MNERIKKLIIIVAIIVCIIYAGYQLSFIFEKGPENLFGIIIGDGAGVLSILFDLLLIGVIILSRNYISTFFKSRSIWKFCLSFLLLAITLDFFFEISFQYSTPSFQILWVALLIRSYFFLPWITSWFVLLYFFTFSKKTLFILAALQGIIGEFIISELFFPGFGMAAKLGYDPLAITFGACLTILLYGCNLVIPYTPFEESFEQKLIRRESSLKYLLSFIPLYAFPLAFSVLQIAIQSGFPYL